MIEAINWNRIQDDKDHEVWNRLTANFWLPEKVPLSNDLPTWNAMTEAEQLLVMRVFTGLALLDTVQGTVGAVSLIPDALTQHEESVYANIAFMERFAEGTELLTEHGWKPIEDITPEDLVAQYHPDTNGITFTHPVRIYQREWRDEMFVIQQKNGNARQVVSGGHRVYYEEKSKHVNSCKRWEPRTVEARELVNVNLRTAHRRFRTAGQAPSGAGMTAVDKLLVAISADGSYLGGSGPRCTGEKTGTLPCVFTFAKERKSERLLRLAEEAGWNLVELTPDTGGKNVRRRFRLDVPLQYSQGRDKSLLVQWNISAITFEWAREFVHECGLWDGHKLVSGQGITFYSTDSRDNDFFTAAATLAGYRARTSVRVDERSDSFKDSYVTYASFTKDTVGAQSMTVERSEGAWTHCIQVPSTYLVTRNGSTPVISGNCVHAKSYSSVFSTLASTKQIDAAFEWGRTSPHLQRKAELIVNEYVQDDPAKKKIASTLLESFLFYSGFYLPLRLASTARLTNTADLIRLIIRDEAVHGYYIGYKYQRGLEAETPERRAELEAFTYELLEELYENETAYTEHLYDTVGWTEDAKAFLHYNANKALNNLGYDALFPADACKFNPGVMTSLNPGADENHDFFSGSGSSYVIGTSVNTEDEDWAF